VSDVSAPTLAETFARLSAGSVASDAVYATLAPVYRALYAARGRIDGQERLVREYAPADATHVLELGCGTGDLAARLARSFDVVATDPSPQMCRLARTRTRETDADVVLGTAHAFAPESVDVVAALGAVVGHIRPDAAAAETLERVYETLRPGGHLVCSVHDRRALVDPRERELSVETDRFEITQRDRQEPTTGGEFVWRVEYELARQTTGERVTTDQQVRIRAYGPAEFETLLADAGFAVEFVRPRTFVDGDGEDGRALVAVARRA
jgi:SAM-dependent methyltransferase